MSLPSINSEFTGLTRDIFNIEESANLFILAFCFLMMLINMKKQR